MIILFWSFFFGGWGGGSKFLQTKEEVQYIKWAEANFFFFKKMSRNRVEALPRPALAFRL